eukprot:4951233-Lingulodinium_polyedra.AAC.1
MSPEVLAAACKSKGFSPSVQTFKDKASVVMQPQAPDRQFPKHVSYPLACRGCCRADTEHAMHKA